MAHTWEVVCVYGVPVSSTAIRVPAITDISGPVWIDLEIPEPVHRDEFVCDRCWLVCHVSREVFWQVCDECA